MNIRSITAFVDVAYPLNEEAVIELGRVVSTVRDALIETGFTVQTTRMAVQPFPEIVSLTEALPLAKALEAAVESGQFDYVSLGPVRLSHPEEYLVAIPDILVQTETAFASIEVANRETGIGLQRIRAASEVIQRVAHLREDGFANLRLAVLANVGPWSPFFPAAYHGGDHNRIALAIEGADLAVTATGQAASLQEARARLIWAIESNAEQMEAVVRQALGHAGVAFQGIDFSLAPYPEDTRSIGTALEQLGLPAFGGAGSLLAAAFLTDALDRAQFTRTGFCGLMLPVLEDSRLALRAAEGALQVSDLLVYSAVCGTGLDTIPLPGDIDQDRLASALMDMSALALRLNKPLTARFMPLPGKRAGDKVTFDFEYFADSRVMDISGGRFSGLLARDEAVDIHPLSRS